MNGIVTRFSRRMGSYCWLLVGLLALLPTGLLLAQDEPEVLVELSRRRIYEGESVQYEVLLNNVQNPKPPKLEGMDDFDVEFLGENSRDMQQIITINGRTTRIVRYGRAYQYALTPKRAGLLPIPGPVAEVEGRRLQGRLLTLEVIPPSDQDLALLEIVTDRDRVYPMQPFTVRLTITVKALPEPFADRNPVSVLRQVPALSIPWVDDESLPAGLHPERSWQEWLEPMRSRRGGGFGVNNIGSRSVFSIFDDGPLGFMPTPRRTSRDDASGQPANYWEFDFERRFTPHAVGEYSFGPVTLKGPFVTAVDANARADTENVFAVAKPRAVTCQDVPAEGRPDSYIQAIGKFTVEASLIPPEAKVGDPLTLTISLRGEGTLDAARPPDLTSRSDITDQFRVYEATEESRDGARLFTYSLRPLEAGEIAFPAVSVSYFDVEQERYVTLKTQPLSLVVQATEHIGDGEIATAATNRGADRSIEERQDGILANVADLTALRNQAVRPARSLMYVSLLGVAYLGVLLISRQLQRYLGDPAQQRRRMAPGRARDRLRAARAEIKAGQHRRGAEQLGAALVGLVADMTDQPEAGMTSQEVGRQLAACNVDDALRQRVAALLEGCDGARYGASTGDVENLGDLAQQMVNELVKALKSDRR